MIYLLCSACKLALRVSPGETPGECESLLGPGSEWYPDNYPCFSCGRGASIMEPGDVGQDVEVHDVSPKEAFAALHGLGLPEEKDCTAEAVRALLPGAKIQRVAVRQIRNSHRCVIDYLELEDGTRVYFGAGPPGAIIYRVSPKHSYAKAVDHE